MIDKVKDLRRCTVVRVVDGDTVLVMVALGLDVHRELSIRLARINTPERKQAGYQEAKNRTSSFLPVGIEFDVDLRLMDKYDRIVCEVQIDGANISDVLLAEGLARPYEDKQTRAKAARENRIKQ